MLADARAPPPALSLSLSLPLSPSLSLSFIPFVFVQVLALGDCDMWDASVCEMLGGLGSLEHLRLEVGGDSIGHHLSKALLRLQKQVLHTHTHTIHTHSLSRSLSLSSSCPSNTRAPPRRYAGMRWSTGVLMCRCTVPAATTATATPACGVARTRPPPAPVNRRLGLLRLPRCPPRLKPAAADAIRGVRAACLHHPAPDLGPTSTSAWPGCRAWTSCNWGR